MATPQQVRQKVELEVNQAKKRLKKGFNAKKYLGAVKWGQDAVVYQRELRGDD